MNMKCVLCVFRFEQEYCYTYTSTRKRDGDGYMHINLLIFLDGVFFYECMLFYFIFCTDYETDSYFFRVSIFTLICSRSLHIFHFCSLFLSRGVHFDIHLLPSVYLHFSLSLSDQSFFFPSHSTFDQCQVIFSVTSATACYWYQYEHVLQSIYVWVF